MEQDRPYVRRRLRMSRKSSSTAQDIQLKQSWLPLADYAKGLGLPEDRRHMLAELLLGGLARVEKPASPDIVDAYVRLQKAAYALQETIDSVMELSPKGRYLDKGLQKLQAALGPLLRPDKPELVDEEARFAADGIEVRFSFSSKTGRPTDYATELACEAALAWWGTFKKWPSPRGEGHFHKMLKFACWRILGMQEFELPGKVTVAAGIKLCQERLQSGWSGSRVYDRVDATGTRQIRAKRK